MGVSNDTMVDLDVIATGGQNFTARMENFFAAKKQMEDAIAELQLGRAAKDAFAEADAARAKAKDTLEKAKAKADEILSQAKDKADATLASANTAVAERMNGIQAQEADLKARTDAFNQQVADATAEAKAAAAESKKATAEAKKATAAAEKAQSDADAEKSAALAARQKYETAYTNLMNSIQAARVVE